MEENQANPKNEFKLCFRLSSADAHYAGELVSGGQMMGWFGDVATALLIAHDFEEGLFRAYESVDFLAPVRAGDYVEVTGVMERIGNRSRTLGFTAYKIIEALPQKPGAARLLKTPVLVAKARGTCIVSGLGGKNE
jgi:3-aminobutyryl-CoA ammonia-lyase